MFRRAYRRTDLGAERVKKSETVESIEAPLRPRPGVAELWTALSASWSHPFGGDPAPPKGPYEIRSSARCAGPHAGLYLQQKKDRLERSFPCTTYQAMCGRWFWPVR